MAWSGTAKGGHQEHAVQTNFSLTQLADPAMAASEKILRTCVH